MKRIVSIALVALAVMLPAAAAVTRSPSAYADISFSGTTVFCFVSVEGDSANEQIEAYIELWEDDSMVDTWEESGTGYVEWSRSFSATSGETYTLVAYATVNGRDLPTEYVTEVCP